MQAASSRFNIRAIQTSWIKLDAIAATLAGKLGEFFGVSPALFIPKA